MTLLAYENQLFSAQCCLPDAIAYVMRPCCLVCLSIQHFGGQIPMKYAHTKDIPVGDVKAIFLIIKNPQHVQTYLLRVANLYEKISWRVFFDIPVSVDHYGSHSGNRDKIKQVKLYE
ncbi:hypothetical protein F2P81_023694 [Scophthalmus maximus]|uniref:Uncharacterized protein n=1 Tax=Scophthalmus maximus TaxID=52904 RepID=A0A6A4RX80_SCOMX|nr:hypothetical protein F2P81_023694 [Scophthalmus maximus]